MSNKGYLQETLFQRSNLTYSLLTSLVKLTIEMQALIEAVTKFESLHLQGKYNFNKLVAR